LVAIGVEADGYQQILGVAEGEKEDVSGWRGFLQHLKDRGLRTPRLIVSDACRGLVEAVNELYPQARWQRCVVHYYRNVFSHVPNSKVAEVARMLKPAGYESRQILPYVIARKTRGPQNGLCEPRLTAARDATRPPSPRGTPRSRILVAATGVLVASGRATPPNAARGRVRQPESAIGHPRDPRR
jgi:hypothetical protein